MLLIFWSERDAILFSRHDFIITILVSKVSNNSVIDDIHQKQVLNDHDELFFSLLYQVFRLLVLLEI